MARLFPAQSSQSTAAFVPCCSQHMLLEGSGNEFQGMPWALVPVWPDTRAAQGFMPYYI